MTISDMLAELQRKGQAPPSTAPAVASTGRDENAAHHAAGADIDPVAAEVAVTAGNDFL